MVSGNSAIYRLDTAGQLESTAPINEVVEFNSGAIPDDLGRVLSSNVTWTRDIAMHPNPKRALNILQDTLAGTKEVVVIGYFRDPIASSGVNSGLEIMDRWMDEKATNASLKFGRFGLRLNDFSINTKTPTATQGYILHSLFAERPEDSPDEVQFIAKLYWNNPTTPP